ncbi:MAG: hypothetical protein NTX43_13075 [Bacteroidetes bacterium]|nr:hypothetical protein [Bacteroidota bacterium]
MKKTGQAFRTPKKGAIVAALGIVAFKLTHKPPLETAKKACCALGSSASCDTTKKAGCDTTKNSSCCPKK